MSARNWRSVAESSTTSMFLIGMGRAFRWRSGGDGGTGHVPVDVLGYRGDQPFARKRLGQVAVRAGEPPARAIEYPVLAREHDDGSGAQRRVLLDERAGLVAVEPRHHDVDEDDLRLVIRDLGERVEAVFSQEHFVAGLAQEHLRALPDRVAVVDDEYSDRPRSCVAHAVCSPHVSTRRSLRSSMLLPPGPC